MPVPTRNKSVFNEIMQSRDSPSDSGRFGSYGAVARIEMPSAATSTDSPLYPHMTEHRISLRQDCAIVESVRLSTFGADDDSNPPGGQFGDESISCDPVRQRHDPVSCDFSA